MIKYFKTLNESLIQLNEIQENIWINMINPTEEEINIVSNSLSIPQDHIRAALDEEERSRIEVDENCTLILVDVPFFEENDGSKIYTTLPMGIILSGENIITVCLKAIPLLNDFMSGKIKSFYTFKKSRFILQLLFKNATYYLQYLKQIDRMSLNIERELHKSMKNKELIQLLDLEKSLVYFSTSLRGNEIVLEKMLKLDAIKKYPEDEDLLEDVIIENKQAIEMANIYSNILSGMMDAFASVISNNLNIVMKFLTSVTIVLTIPTMIASFFGMNVPVPLSMQPYAFIIIIAISLGLSTILALFMAKKKMF
ncbi:MAG: magnesium transporter [Clostridiales bacterium]|jgi:magnesium transporter|nr:magnesium transporter [Clostridiales bacterium]